MTTKPQDCLLFLASVRLEQMKRTTLRKTRMVKILLWFREGPWGLPEPNQSLVTWGRCIALLQTSLVKHSLVFSSNRVVISKTQVRIDIVTVTKMLFGVNVLFAAKFVLRMWIELCGLSLPFSSYFFQNSWHTCLKLRCGYLGLCCLFSVSTRKVIREPHLDKPNRQTPQTHTHTHTSSTWF